MHEFETRYTKEVRTMCYLIHLKEVLEQANIICSNRNMQC